VRSRDELLHDGAFFGAAPFGSLLAGTLARRIGAPPHRHRYRRLLRRRLAMAYDYGYNVVLVVDAMTDRNADAHRHSVEKIFPRLGETTKTDNVLKLLKEAPAQ
jgi:hypothetical protein